MNHSLALLIVVSATAFVLAACASKPERIGFEEARAMFAARGVQPGQPLPALSLVDLAGKATSVASLQPPEARLPTVIVTASLTCNVARRQQKNVDALRQQFTGKILVVVVYTIEAHPKGDACPYTGKEWVPNDNQRDSVLVKQPTSIDERLALARDYQQRFSHGAIVLVDTMDNASWHALGKAPNLGLLVDEHGIVRLRQGWFDLESMRAVLEEKTGI